jgi:hypothetical protein
MRLASDAFISVLLFVRIETNSAAVIGGSVEGQIFSGLAVTTTGTPRFRCGALPTGCVKTDVPWSPDTREANILGFDGELKRAI